MAPRGLFGVKNVRIGGVGGWPQGRHAFACPLAAGPPPRGAPRPEGAGSTCAAARGPRGAVTESSRVVFDIVARGGPMRQPLGRSTARHWPFHQLLRLFALEEAPTRTDERRDRARCVRYQASSSAISDRTVFPALGLAGNTPYRLERSVWPEGNAGIQPPAKSLLS